MTRAAADADKPRVLVADDEAVARRLLEVQLADAGFAPVVAADGREALEKLDDSVQVAVVDLEMPGVSGLEFLAQARKRFPDLPVLVVSQHDQVADAVAAMKAGATEYVTKPVDADELRVRIGQALGQRALKAENAQLRQAVTGPSVSATLVGESASTERLLAQARKIAGLDATVLITGESGTGKSTLARLIHQMSGRAAGPLVTVSCTSLPRDLIEAELFGHAKGAFTGAHADRPGRVEMADGGTLFLDEIGDLPLELQPKLLTFLQDRTFQRIGDRTPKSVDVRVISATHQPLKEKVAEGSFRDDLYFRIAVLPLAIAPLRDRPDDLDALVGRILSRIAAGRGTEPFSLTAAARERLRRHGWPGNVRELENVLERATAFADASTIDVADLSLSDQPESAPPATLAGMSLADIERRAILETLAFCGGNKRAAARTLGIDEKSIYNKIRRLEIEDQVAQVVEQS